MAVRIAIGKKPIKPPRLARVHPRVVIISSVVLLAIVSARAVARALHHGRHDEDMYVGYDKDKNNEPNFSGCHARKSTLSGPGFDHQGTWADIKGDCKEFGCFCQPICH